LNTSILKELGLLYSISFDSIVVDCFGRPHNWRPKFKNQEDLKKPEALEQAYLFEIYAQKHGATKIYAPLTNTFTGLVCDPQELEDNPIVLPDKTVTFYRSYKKLVDGLPLPEESIIFQFPADCPTIVVSCNGKIFAAHAGRDCLFDPGFVHEGERRKHPDRQSVVDEIMQALKPDNHREVFVRIVCSIRARDFSHPTDHAKYGDKNKRLIDFITESFGEGCIHGCKSEGLIDLSQVIKAQFMKYGVPENNILRDDSDTFGDSRLWSNRRGDNERNLVAIRHA